MFAVLATFGVAFALITYKLVSIQGLDNSSLDQVTNAYVARIPLADLRGSILAADGDELALSELRPTIFANPGEILAAAIADRRSVADQWVLEAAALAPVLHLSASVIRADFARDPHYVVIAGDLSEATSQQVINLAEPGIGTEEEPVRVHPDGSLDAAVIGNVNSQGGYSGLEHEYNSALSGTPGELVESVDLHNHPIPGSVTTNTPAVNGDDILTTINENLEYQTEQALAKAVTSAKSQSGTAIVMDRRTGALLAVANVVASRHGPVQAPNALAFTAVYEPGSVGKIITLSAGLTEGLITPTTKITIPTTYTVAGTVFHDAEYHPTEQLTATGILAQSSNIGAIQIGQKLGAERLYHYEEAYGLDKPTAVGFPGESAGLVTPLANFSGTTLPTLAFGQDDAFTAAQMIAAVNTVANGGVYVSPRLVKAVDDANGREHAIAYPAPHRVIPAATAAEVTTMLEQVVSTGTGVPAQIPSYGVAGKTGTGDALKDTGSGYIGGEYVSSFAGFAPAQNPAVTVMVEINKTPQYGSAAAAPAFAQITEDALLDLGIPSAGPQPKPAVDALPIIDGKPETSLLGQ